MLNYDLKRGLFLPKDYSPELAELVGIIFGDGYLSEKYSHSYRLSIFRHSIWDYEYHTLYLKNLIKNLFGIETKVLIRKDMYCLSSSIFSKRIVNFLKNIGIKTERKKELKIPLWILKKDNYMASFLKGFIDTDGSLALKKRYKKLPYYPVIGLASKSKTLIGYVATWLRNKEFSLWLGCSKQIDKRSGKVYKTYGICLNGDKQLTKWVNSIGFSNKKHIQKYKIWLNKRLQKTF